ncbi:MAG TPA: MFS transporter [Rhodocyclaceae bacterium]|nr:MFS transporter [Rhodocyclaceae bacterium]
MTAHKAFPYARLAAYYFFYFAFIGAFSPYFGLYLQAIEFSALDIGLLMSQMQLMRVFGPNVWGWVVDRFGYRLRIIRLAGLIGLLGFVSFFWLDRLPGMLLAMAVLAFFWSGALPLVEMLTFDHLREEGGRYGPVRVWGSVGFIVAVLATGLLLDFMPPVGVLWACTLILAGLLLLALSLPEAPPHPAGSPAASIVAVLRRPPVLALMLACTAMSTAHGGFYVFFSIHLSDHGYGKAMIGLLWSLGVLAEIGVFLLMPRLLRRFSLRAILLVSFAAAVPRFLLMGWAVDSLLTMLLVQSLHGLTFGAYHAAAIAAVNQYFPQQLRGRGQALYSSLSFGAGGLLGALLSGLFWEPWGAGWVFALAAVFGLLGFCLIWRWFAEAGPAGVGGENLPENA